VASIASASRARSPWRTMLSASRFCSPGGKLARVLAVVAESRPSSRWRPSSGVSRRPSVKRRSTQPRPRPSSLVICVGES
jgi:hypothetical protein